MEIEFAIDVIDHSKLLMTFEDLLLVTTSKSNNRGGNALVEWSEFNDISDTEAWRVSSVCLNVYDDQDIDGDYKFLIFVMIKQ